MNLNKENMKKIQILILFTVVVVAVFLNYTLVFSGFHLMFRVVLPFILGGAIAFVINVPMRFFERKVLNNKHLSNNRIIQRIARPLSLIVTVAAILGIVVLVIFVVFPEMKNTVYLVGENVQTFIPRVQTYIENLASGNTQIQTWINNLEFDFQTIVKEIVDLSSGEAGDVLNSSVEVIGSLVNGVTNIVIAVIFSFYILFQKEKLGIQIKKALYAFLPEKKVEKGLGFTVMTEKAFSRFLSGQCLEALILGAMFFIVLTLFRMPYAMVIGVLIAVTSVIPMFGAWIGCIVGTLLLLVTNPFQALIFLILFFVLQQIEGNLIYPRIVGESVGLPAIWVLVAVTIGGNLMGVIGMVIFIPMSAVLYVLFKESVYKRLERKKISFKDIEEASK